MRDSWRSCGISWGFLEFCGIVENDGMNGDGEGKNEETVRNYQKLSEFVMLFR
jgi:hypothetical protein